MFKKLIVGIFLMSISVGYCGHETGNGGNLKDLFEGNAWFVENHPVQYCIIRSKNFISSLDKIFEATKTSLYKWGQLSKKLEFKNSIYPIQNNFVFNKKCSANIDLIFYFGGVPKDISSIIKDYNRSVALAYPTYINKTKTWTKGFIYVKDTNITQENDCFESARSDSCMSSHKNENWNEFQVPDWSYENNLDAILLHEIGHIFGVPHIPLTIMRESLAWNLILDGDLSLDKKYQTEIEHEYSVVPNSLTKDFMVKVGDSIFNISLKNNKKYTLKKVNKKTVDVYEFIPNSKNEVLDFFNSSLMSNANYVFKRSVTSEDDKTFHFEVGAFIEHFIENGLFKINGKTFPGIYSKNMGGFTHQFKIFINGKWTDLFSYKN